MFLLWYSDTVLSTLKIYVNFLCDCPSFCHMHLDCKCMEAMFVLCISVFHICHATEVLNYADPCVHVVYMWCVQSWIVLMLGLWV
jgi:hypothetical protein